MTLRGDAMPCRSQGPITLLGFDYPDSMVLRRNGEDENPPIQTQLFARRLTRAILHGFNKPVYCISAAPISEYPINKRLLVTGDRPTVIELPEGEAHLIPIAYINHKTLKIISRTITTIAACIRRSFNQGNGVVFVYSVHVPLMIGGLLLSRWTNSISVAVWTDPPAVPLQTDGRLLGRLLRRFEAKLAAKLMRSFRLVVALTDQLANDWAPRSPHLVMEAMTDDAIAGTEPVYRSEGKTIFTYTGGLDRRYGVDRLAEGALLVAPEYEFVVQFFGEGDYASELRRLSLTSSRIEFHGRVDHTAAVRAQTESDFLINVRDPQDEYTKHSFPSKTLEYLLSGVPVISTALPGIPSEYWPHMILLSANEPHLIATAIEESCKMTTGERRRLGQSGLALARTKDFRTQGRRIATFVKQHDC